MPLHSFGTGPASHLDARSLLETAVVFQATRTSLFESRNLRYVSIWFILGCVCELVELVLHRWTASVPTCCEDLGSSICSEFLSFFLKILRVLSLHLHSCAGDGSFPLLLLELLLELLGLLTSFLLEDPVILTICLVAATI